MNVGKRGAICFLQVWKIIPNISCFGALKILMMV